MTYMEQIAKMLDVEIGEEFKIEGHDDNLKFQFTENRFLQSYGDVYGWVDSISIMTVLEGRAKIIKIPKSILTDKEKEDLSGIIRLFRDEVISICKFESMRHCGYEFLSIKINNNVFKYETTLPYFKKWAMYKGMKLEKEYSLEDLGL